MNRESPKLSLCAPLFNEESNIPALFERVSGALTSLPGGPHEFIVVDDGSTDRTPELLARYSREPLPFEFRCLLLSRNFGHQAALSAALDQVQGDACILIDGDLQDPPELIGEFLSKFKEGYDVVYAQRVRRKESLPLRLCYKLYYRIAGALAETPLPLDSGDFSLISRRVVNVMRDAPERKRYLRGLRAWAGFKQIGIEVERAARHSGRSKYSLLRLLRLAGDGIFSFSVVPLRLASLFGAATCLGALTFALYALYVKFWLHESPQGFTALTFLLVLFSGTNLLFLGIIGEYVGRIYEEAKQRPLYVVAETLHSEPRDR